MEWVANKRSEFAVKALAVWKRRTENIPVYALLMCKNSALVEHSPGAIRWQIALEQEISRL